MRFLVLFLFLLLTPLLAGAANFVPSSTPPAAFQITAQKQLDDITAAHYRVYIGGYKNDHANVWAPDPDGDCQGKTAWMMQELLSRGVPASAMRGYIGVVNNQWHAWLVVSVILPNGQRANLLVDSLNESVAYVGEVKGYSRTRPVVRIDD